MKRLFVVAAFIFANSFYLQVQLAWADSVDASCEFFKHGDMKHYRSGACSFSQRQGYVDIKLKDGSAFSLSPRDQANKFKDQEGNKVDRAQASDDYQVYEWHNDRQKIVVTFTDGASKSHGRSEPFAAKK